MKPPTSGFLQDLLDNANDMILILTPDGRLIYANRKWRKEFGYGNLDWTRIFFLETVHPDYRAQIEDAWKRSLAGEACRRLDAVLVTKEGGTVIVEGNIQPRLKNGKTHAVRVIFRDVTENRRVELALQAAHERISRSVKELELRTREIEILTELADMLLSCQTPDEGYKIVSRLVPALLPAFPGALVISSAPRSQLHTRSAWGNLHTGFRPFYPQDCWALRRGRIHIVRDPESPLRCPHVRQDKPLQSLCVPLMAQGDALGLIHLQSTIGKSDAAFSGDVERLVLALADRISLALAILRLRESLQQQAIRDPLTGLFNRRYLSESLDRELRRAARGKRPLGIIMIDIDCFKRINDSYGHAAGDLVLREFGATLSGSIRGEDMIFRYGGDEFVLILPEASLEAACQRADQLRREAKELKVHFNDHVLGGLSLSIGVGSFPDVGANSDSLLRAVDRALYRAKGEGRNRVTVAQIIDMIPSSASPLLSQ